MTDEELQIVDAMISMGGSFVQALGRAAMLADAHNFARLQHAFADYFDRYANLAGLKRQRQQESK